jgi:hypothetical protein
LVVWLVGSLVCWLCLFRIRIFLFGMSIEKPRSAAALTAGPVVAAARARAVNVDVAAGRGGAERAASLGRGDVVDEGDDVAGVVGPLSGGGRAADSSGLDLRFQTTV